MSLGAYVARRLLHLVPIALGVTILVFFLIHLVPGDPARTILGNQATNARVALVRHQWGLDRPLPVQYEKFMGRVVHGDLGNSLFYDVSAGHLVLQRLPVTLWLIGFGALLAALIAVPLAAVARPGATGSPTISCGWFPSSGSAFHRSGWASSCCSLFGLTWGGSSRSAATATASPAICTRCSCPH